MSLWGAKTDSPHPEGKAEGKARDRRTSTFSPPRRGDPAGSRGSFWCSDCSLLEKRTETSRQLRAQVLDFAFRYGFAQSREHCCDVVPGLFRVDPRA